MCVEKWAGRAIHSELSLLCPWTSAFRLQDLHHQPLILGSLDVDWNSQQPPTPPPPPGSTGSQDFTQSEPHHQLSWF